MCWKLVKLTVWVNGVVILCIIFVPCVAVNFLLIKMLNLGVVVVLLFSACLKGICWFAYWWEFCACLMGLGVCIPSQFVFLCMILLFRY